MSERPILFSGPMVRAILDGRKTQTRRIVKKRSVDEMGDPITVMPRDGYTPDTVVADYHCPYGRSGDLLYVRENARLEFAVDPEEHFVRFQADDTARGPLEVDQLDDDATLRWIESAEWVSAGPEYMVTRKWRPGMLVPKALSRLWLRVTDVRVERVQELSEEDAVAEGVGTALNLMTAVANSIHGRSDPTDTHRNGFMALWDDLNAARGYGWDANPWVWVLTFERTETP